MLTSRPPETAAEVLAMVLCRSADLLGGGADPLALVPVKQAIIRRFNAARARRRQS
jgi:hypothetical protein